MFPLRRIVVAVYFLLFLFVGGMSPLGSHVSAAEDRELSAAEVDGPVATGEIDTGDNAWMLTSSALVLMMTAPGLAMFYCGLVRKKNVLSVMMQCIAMMAVMSVLWAVIGYSLAFGGSNPWIGNMEHVLLRGVQCQWVDGQQVVPMADGLGIPMLTHMLFQGMFFIITPALICGAFAERMKFSAMLVFNVLWGLLVYCPLCHWVWGGGCLAYGAEGAIAGGVLDFAGGIVVHLSSGASALVCALIIDKRLGFGSEPMPPHNMTYTAIGATMLWVGWFGFNGGSALASNGLAANAFAVTHFGAAAGAIAWAGLERIQRGKASILGACSGLVAGLAGVTATTGFVQPTAGIVIGFLCGVACYFACTSLKNYFNYDDSLDVFGVHGISGLVGTIMVGVFATRAVTDPAVSGGELLGMVEGGSIMVGQLVAILITAIYCVVITFILLKVLDNVMGLRVDAKVEIEGLDLQEHGEEGYILL